MKFLDEAIISVSSGKGGRGCVSFRREKFIPRGGPDGGDGGKGGDVVLKTTRSKHTLYQFKFKKEFKAQNGSYGQGKAKTGKNGNDLIIKIPHGTIVSNLNTSKIIKDFVYHDESFIIAKGGRGGRGNKRFVSSTNRSPKYAQPGEPGLFLTIKLELKLLSDVGLVGLPNAGKSTLIAALSSAKPKIGAYPFTTLTPNLGVVYTQYDEPFIVADMPGLIKEAHKGTGLGTQFLKHIERTKIIVHLIDASSIDIDSPTESYDIVKNELFRYSKALAEKPQIIVLSKMDVLGTNKLAKAFKSAVKDSAVITISAQTGQNLEKLKSKIVQCLRSKIKKDN